MSIRKLDKEKTEKLWENFDKSSSSSESEDPSIEYKLQMQELERQRQLEREAQRRKLEELQGNSKSLSLEKLKYAEEQERLKNTVGHRDPNVPLVPVEELRRGGVIGGFGSDDIEMVRQNQTHSRNSVGLLDSISNFFTEILSDDKH